MIIIHLSEQLAHQSIFIIFLVIPNHANLVVAECTFDRDSCSWRNTSTGDFEWRMATLNRRPSNLPDKTFGAPVGYAYFDIFNSGSRLDIHQFIYFQIIFLMQNLIIVYYHTISIKLQAKSSKDDQSYNTWRRF